MLSQQRDQKAESLTDTSTLHSTLIIFRVCPMFLSFPSQIGVLSSYLAGTHRLTAGARPWSKRASDSDHVDFASFAPPNCSSFSASREGGGREGKVSREALQFSLAPAPAPAPPSSRMAKPPRERIAGAQLQAGRREAGGRARLEMGWDEAGRGSSLLLPWRERPSLFLRPSVSDCSCIN